MSRYKLHTLETDHHRKILFIFSKDGTVIDAVPYPKSSGLPPFIVKLYLLIPTENEDEQI